MNNDKHPQKKTQNKSSSTKAKRSNAKPAHNMRTNSSAPTNDVSWYTRYPELINAAARIPFAYQNGKAIPVTISQAGSGGVPGTVTNIKTVLPGIAVLEWAPTVGYTTGSMNDPVNTTAQQLWAQIRSKFSGGLDVDPPDIMMYVCALDSMYSMLESVKRAYKTLNLWSPTNLYFPRAVVKAMGFDYDDLVAHKEDLYGYINVVVRRLQQFLLPKEWTMLHRHKFLNERVYFDENTARSGVYIFRQRSFWKMGASTDTGTLLTSENPFDYDAGVTYDQIVSTMDEYLNAFATNEDTFITLGYITRAFEGSDLTNITLLDHDSYLEPVYDEEVLLQIANADNINWSTYKENAFGMTQDPSTNMINHQPTFSVSAVELVPEREVIMNMNSDQPTTDDVVIGSRFKYWAELVSGDDVSNTYAIHAATEVILGIYMYIPDKDPGNLEDTLKMQFQTYRIISASDPSPNAEWLDCHMSNWMHFPLQKLLFLDDTEGRYLFKGPVHNVSPVAAADLDLINRYCIYSELNAFTK